jgi:hypothetical protein
MPRTAGIVAWIFEVLHAGRRTPIADDLESAA